MDAFTLDTPAIDQQILDIAEGESIGSLSNKIITLKSNLDSMTKNWEYSRDRANGLLNKIKEFTNALKDHVSEESIDPDIAQMYAEIFDIVLTKKYDVSVTVTFSGTAEVPLGMDSITHNVSISFDEGWSNGVEWDMTEDDIDWDIQEAY